MDGTLGTVEAVRRLGTQQRPQGRIPAGVLDEVRRYGEFVVGMKQGPARIPIETTAKSTWRGGTARSSAFRETRAVATGVAVRPVFTARIVATRPPTTASTRFRNIGRFRRAGRRAEDAEPALRWLGQPVE